jgi:hypothetical protein
VQNPMLNGFTFTEVEYIGDLHQRDAARFCDAEPELSGVDSRAGDTSTGSFS